MTGGLCTAAPKQLYVVRTPMIATRRALLELLLLSSTSTALCPFAQFMTFGAIGCDSVTPTTARPTTVRLNDDCYGLGGVSSQLAGGDQILRRFAGSDVTALFYSNHFDGFDTKLQRLERHRTARPSGESGLPHLDSHNASVPLSDLYAALKMEVKVALASAAPGRGHRARFPLRPLLARYAVLGLAAAAAATAAASVSAAAVPAAAGSACPCRCSTG